MKRNAILLMGIFSAHLASAQLFSDNFDNYALGSYIGPQSNNWTTWSGTQGGAEDVTTTNNQAASAPHSVYFSRSEERRVGKECIAVCRSRWSPYH